MSDTKPRRDWAWFCKWTPIVLQSQKNKNKNLKITSELGMFIWVITRNTSSCTCRYAELNFSVTNQELFAFFSVSIIKSSWFSYTLDSVLTLVTGIFWFNVHCQTSTFYRISKRMYRWWRCAPNTPVQYYCIMCSVFTLQYTASWGKHCLEGTFSVPLFSNNFEARDHRMRVCTADDYATSVFLTMKRLQSSASFPS